MYAVVEIAGEQFKVSKSDKLQVPLLETKAGQTVKFEKVLLIGDYKKTTIGAPYVQGSQVEAKVLGHGKDDKVLVFKKKKRKGYKVLKGHRQAFTEVEILSVG